MSAVVLFLVWGVVLLGVLALLYGYGEQEVREERTPDDASRR